MKDIRTREIQFVTWVGLGLNLVLSVSKVMAGILGFSTAMVADGIHSLSDMVTDVIVILFIGISGKEEDWNHPYGHGKFETFAAFIISIVLFFVGLGILKSGVEAILLSLDGIYPERPAPFTILAALVSIIVKEGLFWYTKLVGDRVKSELLIANAWHHRSDSFSSIGTFLGISGAVYLSEAWRILDPIAGILVSLLIWKVSWDIAKPSVEELLETALPIPVQENLITIILSTKGVRSYRQLKTRKIGDQIGIDTIILVDKNLTLERAHDIAEEVESAIRSAYGEKSHIGIHMEPHEE